jgi:hypothetical protein
MNEMNEEKKIAVGVDQNGGLWLAHFGMSPYYFIYDKSGLLLEKRHNPYGAPGPDAKHHGNPHQIISLLSDCHVFIARAMGKPAQLEKLGVRPVLTQENNPQIAVATFLESDSLPAG